MPNGSLHRSISFEFLQNSVKSPHIRPDQCPDSPTMSYAYGSIMGNLAGVQPTLRDRWRYITDLTPFWPGEYQDAADSSGELHQPWSVNLEYATCCTLINTGGRQQPSHRLRGDIYGPSPFCHEA